MKKGLEVVLNESLATVRIAGVPFPFRDGWDYDGVFSARPEDSRHRMVFVLRQSTIEDGFAGKNYRRGVVWTRKGYMDMTFFLDSGLWRTNDAIFEAGGYDDPLSPMIYVEEWEGFDLAKL